LGVLLFRRSPNNGTRDRKKSSGIIESIAIDGKSVRGAIPRRLLKTTTHIVNSVCNFFTIAVNKVDEKSNEILTYPIILYLLNQNDLLAGRVITTDAMGCQKKIAELIIDYDVDYLLHLKQNHKLFYENIENAFTIGLSNYSNEFNSETYEAPPEKKGGKIVSRTITVIDITSGHACEWVPEAEEWKEIKTIVKVEKKTEPVAAWKDNQKKTEEVKYFISSLELSENKLLSAKKILEITIKHWEVETLHKILDDKHGFAEDASKVYRGNSAEVLSTLRKLALNFIIPINQLYKESVCDILNMFNSCIDYLEAVINQRPEDVGSGKQWRRNNCLVYCKYNAKYWKICLILKTFLTLLN
jgi:predicted transposase YbfD/YdcC